MPRSGPANLDIEADVALVVTTPDGRSTTARAVGEGSRLRIETARPDVLLAAVDRAGVGPLADALDTAGISIHVDGPGGRVATIGSAGYSRLGRLLTGSINTAIRPRILASAIRPGTAVPAAAVVAAVVTLAVRTARARPS